MLAYLTNITTGELVMVGLMILFGLLILILPIWLIIEIIRYLRRH